MGLPASLLKVRIAGGAPTAAETNRIQDNVGTLLNEVAAVPILQANTVSVDFSSNLTQSVAHGLGRAWVGWSITDKNQPAIIYRSSVANREQFLTLTADQIVTISVMVW